MTKEKKYFISIIFFLLLLFLTYWFIFKNYDFMAFFSSLKQLDIKWIILGFLFFFCYLLCECLFLKSILNHVGYKVSLKHTIGYFFTEKYFSAITPSSVGGQPVEMVEMRKDGIKYDASSAIILLNTMLYKVALIVIATFGFLILPHFIFKQSLFFSWLVILGYISTIFVILLFGMLLFNPKMTNFLKKLLFKFIKKDKWKKKIEEMLKNYHECSLLIRKNKGILLKSFIFLFGQRIFLLSISFCVYKSFYLSGYNLLELIFISSFITLGSDFMPTPGGVMVYEGMLLEANKMIYGDLYALSGMFLNRTITFYFLVLISLIGYLIFHFRK